MATEYTSAASWSKKITVAGDGATPYMIQTIGPKMGVSVVATTGSITLDTTLGSPDAVAANSCTWTTVTITAGEAMINMPISAIRVTGAGGAAGTVFLIQ